ncbi:ribonuclease H [Halogeometricum borinquense DSM 11551]|uniref:Ribonuclease H n=1 Tax=Halogeometricum borinquense (strain ATCC 700274 / DSM 11551 / JCM 10706 / KCTC 4070 / PR3) TaxID=469382 RepID=E4NVF0_HALBP|nr:RNase H family protein [Halogeometricum borinquense]ADQ68834.1 ribonuclease HI [Halogeometricum borinquense DSM 11551]ELY28735.1 ribonuclease H [Halogeometricum borinquense DSM 11551]
MTEEPLPVEHCSPLATLVDEVLARIGYEIAAATDAIDAAVPGYGGLFDPTTTPSELRRALDSVLVSDLSQPPAPEPTGNSFILYVDGSSRGNPGPAGAGAVIMDATETELARLGRPVSSRTGNNTAEYVALQLGIAGLLARYELQTLEVRIDSMTVIRDVWDGHYPVSLCPCILVLGCSRRLVTLYSDSWWTSGKISSGDVSVTRRWLFQQQTIISQVDLLTRYTRRGLPPGRSRRRERS